MSEFEETKRCCTVCDAKKVCHICKEQTLYACSDCAISFGASVYVCHRSACRNEHEKKCSHTLEQENEGLRGQVEHVLSNMDSQSRIVSDYFDKVQALEAQLRQAREALDGRCLMRCSDCGTHWWAKQEPECVQCPTCGPTGGTIGWYTFKAIREKEQESDQLAGFVSALNALFDWNSGDTALSRQVADLLNGVQVLTRLRGQQ